MTIWHMRVICWITKATNIYSKYLTLLAFARQVVKRTRLDVPFIRTLPVFFKYVAQSRLDVACRRLK